MLGIYLQRSWIVLFCCAVLLLPLYLFTTPLLIILGQDPKIASMAGTISLWYIPVMISNVGNFTLQMYLQAQSKNMIVTYFAMLNLGLHLFLSWLLTVKFHLGLAGVMGSMCGIVVQHNFGAPHWLYEECRDCSSCSFNMSAGSANELGAGSARRAKFAIFNVVTTSLSIGFMLFVLFLIFRGRLAYIFTESKVVADAVAELSPLLAFSILLNSVQPVLSGVAVGSGWQSVVAYVNVTSYYLIGIPIGAILGYELGFQLKTIVLLFITLRTDWEKQVEIARKRLNRWFMDRNGRQQNLSENP
uniref:Protein DETOXIFICATION n=1 Tax=Oryza punctata TaxID=4537 RepID=A0A0E0MBZ3_ORYPU